jgi:hypothetical protein
MDGVVHLLHFKDDALGKQRKLLYFCILSDPQDN